MKKSFKIEVDCANCANLVEQAISKMPQIQSVSISFMTQKMKIETADDTDIDALKAEMIKVGRKIESEFNII